MRNMRRRSLLITALLFVPVWTNFAIAAQPTTRCAMPCYPASTLLGLTTWTDPTATPILPLAEATTPTGVGGNSVPPPEEEMLGSGARASVKTHRHQRLQLDLAVNDRPRSPSSSTSPIISGYQKFVRDFWYHFWDPANAIPRIRPFTSLDSHGAGGYVDNALKGLSGRYWMMTESANILYWQWKVSQDREALARLQSQWNEVKNLYTSLQLSSADPSANGGTILVSDDAALALQFLVQVNDATGDPMALADAQNLLASMRSYFADPNDSGCGLLYATTSEDPNRQKQSWIGEALTARSAVYLYEKTGEAQFLTYAEGVWNWIHDCAKHPTGIFFVGADLNPTDPCYKKGLQCDDPHGFIQRGASVAYIGGAMAVCSLSARLYQKTGRQAYLDDIKHVLSAMLSPSTFLRQGSNVGLGGTVLVDDRDGWSDGIYAQNFVYDALSLAGVDPHNTFKPVFINTAKSIINQRTADGYYGADWSGPEALWYDPNTKTWAQQGLKNQNAAVTATASIMGMTLTVTHASAQTIRVGKGIVGKGVAAGTQIIALGTGSGGSGTYMVNTAQTVGSETMSIGHQPTDYCCNGEAEANQVMTSANSGAMLQAAAMLLTMPPAVERPGSKRHVRNRKTSR